MFTVRLRERESRIEKTGEGEVGESTNTYGTYTKLFHVTLNTHIFVVGLIRKVYCGGGIS